MYLQEETAVEPVQDLFTREDLFILEPATNTQRFFNLLIDGVLLRYGMAYLTSYGLMYAIFWLFPNLAYDFYIDQSQLVIYGISYLLGVCNYLAYYTFCEKVFQGITLGKLITRTQAVREDGQPLTLRNAFLRSLSRVVPFEPLSAWIGEGIWHDRWTHTMVIKRR